MIMAKAKAYYLDNRTDFYLNSFFWLAEENFIFLMKQDTRTSYLEEIFLIFSPIQIWKAVFKTVQAFFSQQNNEQESPISIG